LASDTGFSIRATFKRRFLAGLLVSIPVIIKFLIIGWFFKFVDGLLGPFSDSVLGNHILSGGIATPGRISEVKQ
jgi:uncharacterized membrane protein